MKFMENSNNDNVQPGETPLFKNDGNVDLMKAQNGFENIVEGGKSDEVVEPKREVITTPEELNIVPEMKEESNNELINDAFGLPKPVENNGVAEETPVIVETEKPVIENPKKKSKKGLIITLIILLVILAIIVIYYFVLLSPKRVLQNTMNKTYSEIESLETSIKDFFDFSTIKTSGNLSYDTTIKKFSSYKGYNINYEIVYDKANDKVNSTIALLNGSKNELLKANYFLKEGISYIDIIDITPKFIKFNTNKYVDKVNNSEDKIKDIDYNYLINKLGNIIINSIDEKKLNRTIVYNEAFDKALSVKIVYSLDKEEYKNIITSIVNGLKQDDKAIEELAKINNINNDEVKSKLDSIIDETKYIDTNITVYTNVFTNKLMRIDIKNDETTIKYVDNNITKEIAQTEIGETTYSIETIYNMNNKQLQVNVTETEKNITKNIILTISSSAIENNKSTNSIEIVYKPDNSMPDENMTIKVDNSLEIDSTFEDMDISNSSSLRDLTEEESTNMLNALYDFLSGIGYSTLGI